MRALVYNGPQDVSVQNVPDAEIKMPTDVLVKITSTNICGSDLHMYEGRTTLEKGRIIGHENLGEVVEVGSAVQRVKVGDRVCLPFNIGCGFCESCDQGKPHLCLTNNPQGAGAAYGYADAGPWQGGQAEYLQVPFGDFNCLILPEDAQEKENDYVMLADIWPTGYHAVELSGLQPGETIVIYGAGPVGLMAAYSAIIKGAEKVMIVDEHPDRLKLAESIGAIPIDFSKVVPYEVVNELTEGKGADRGCECVGWQCHDPGHHHPETERPEMTLNNLVRSLKPGGSMGVIGVYQPADLHAEDELIKKGQIKFDIGMFFTKALTMGSGQANVKKYNRKLAKLIQSGKATPSFIVSHELPLEEAPNAYKHFDNRDEGWTKVILKPQMQ